MPNAQEHTYYKTSWMVKIYFYITDEGLGFQRLLNAIIKNLFGANCRQPKQRN